MKVGVLLYHRNATQLYKPEWIKQSLESLRGQTFRDFTVFETDYGGDADHEGQFYEGSVFEKNPAPTFADVVNRSLDHLFKNLDYDVVFNWHLDDWYEPDRFAKQLIMFELGYDVVSTDFDYFETVDGVERIISVQNFGAQGLNIRENILAGHCVIGHPNVGWSRNFWLNSSDYEPPPLEDIRLWQREIDKFRFGIVPKVLLHYRNHANQVTYNPQAP